jgi:archaellum component FlaC
METRISILENQIKELTDSVEELKRQMNLLIQLFELKEEIEYNKYDSTVFYNINSEIERIDNRIRSVEWEIERKL